MHEEGSHLPALVARTGPARPFERAAGRSDVWLSAEGAARLNGHIVLITSSLKSLQHFILPLRQPTVPCIPIVILTPLRAGDGTLDDASTYWLDIAEFPAVHLLDTLGDIEADATRAGLGRAMSVVVRSDGPRPTRTYVEHMSDPAAHATRADAVTILTTLRVERCVHPSAHVISEMLHGDTLAQLSANSVGMGGGYATGASAIAASSSSSKPSDSRHGAAGGEAGGGAQDAGSSGSLHGGYDAHADQKAGSPWFEGGSSTLDKFEQELSSIQLSGTSNEDVSERSIVRAASLPGALPQMAACFASGKITLSDVADKLSSQAFFNPHIMPMISALLNPSLHDANTLHEDNPSYGRSKPDGEPPICSAHLSLIHIPERFRDECASRASGGGGGGGHPGNPVEAMPAEVESRAAPVASPPLPTWAELFDWLLEVHGAIGVAMYVRSSHCSSYNGQWPWAPDVGATPEKSASGTARRASALRKVSQVAKRLSALGPAAAESSATVHDTALPAKGDARPASQIPPKAAPLPEAGLRPTPDKKRLSLLSRATSTDARVHKSAADGTPADYSDAVAGDVTRMYVVTNPARSQRLRGNEWIFVLLPPAAMASSHELKHVRGSPQPVATRGVAVTESSMPGSTGIASVPAPPPAGAAAPDARISMTGAESRPAPITTPPPSPPEAQHGELRTELNQLVQALEDERARTDRLVSLLRHDR